MKQLDKLNKELAELRSRIQYQRFELERADNKGDNFKATLTFNRITDLNKLVQSKEVEIQNLLSIR